jgi:hypothetical protein
MSFRRGHYGISDRSITVRWCALLYDTDCRFPACLYFNALLPFDKLYEFGQCIREAVEESDERVVYIASGDLSHRLTSDAPAGYSPKGREYDEALVEKVRKADVRGLLETDLTLLEKAGECGTRSIVMMFGALHGRKPEPEIYSYEGPFGVGYLIARIGTREETDYVRLARETLETYVRDGKKIDVPQWILRSSERSGQVFSCR